MARRLLLIVPMVVFALSGCGGKPADPTGGEGGPCTAERTCHQGLVCVGGICVRARDTGWLDGYPLGDWPRFPESRLDHAGLDSVHGSDLPKPGLDQGKPKLDQGKPKLDQGNPDACKTWSSWSCIATPPTPGVICHASCQGRAIWCDGTGRCFCTISGGSPCATGLPVSFANPCATCQAGLSKGCCL